MLHITARIKPMSSSAANCVFLAKCVCVAGGDRDCSFTQFGLEILPSEFVSNRQFLFSELWGFRIHNKEGIVNLYTELRHIIKGPI